MEEQVHETNTFSSSKIYINSAEATAKLRVATKEHLDLSENIR